MNKIAVIVEGHGEYEALRLLLQRIAATVPPLHYVEIPRPIRISRSMLPREGELERAVELAARTAGDTGGILILLDADDDCPAELGPALLARARAARPDFDIRVVLAKAEYEAWFLAAGSSIHGLHGLDIPAPPGDPEAIRGAKEWLTARTRPGRSCSPTLHQAAFTAAFDLDAARAGAPSFDKMWRDVQALLAAPA